MGDGCADAGAGDGNPLALLRGDEQVEQQIPGRFAEQRFLEKQDAAAAAAVGMPGKAQPAAIILRGEFGRRDIAVASRGRRSALFQFGGKRQQFIGCGDQAARLVATGGYDDGLDIPCRTQGNGRGAAGQSAPLPV